MPRFMPTRMVIKMSIEAAREGFEASFSESDFYNKQTQDEIWVTEQVNNLLFTLT